LEEVAQHNNEKSCWIAIDNKVYDVTNYMPNHPGGEGLILDKAGQDASVAFKEANHSEGAIRKREELLIGTLHKKNSSSSSLVIIVFAIVLVSVGVWFLLGLGNE
jgi:cytochrome b involved in lipid metabolism